MIGGTDPQSDRHTADTFSLFVGVIGVCIAKNRVGKKVVVARTAQVHRVILAVRRSTPQIIAVANLAKRAIAHISPMASALPPSDMRCLGGSIARRDVFPRVIPSVALR